MNIEGEGTMKETNVEKAIQDIYPDEHAWCFGCGRLNKEGHQLRTGWQGDKTVTSFTPDSKYSGGIPKFVYGGLIASLFDCHSSGSASLAMHRKNGNEIGDGALPPRFVTATLNVEYLKPTPQNVPLKAIGTVEEIHPKRWRVKSEMYADDTLCARGEVELVVIPSEFESR